MGCRFLLQGIFPTQESNLSFLCCRQIFFPSDPPWKPQRSQIQHDPRVLVGSSVSSRQDHPSEAPSYTCKEAVLVTVPGQGLQTRVVRSR